MPPPHRHTSVLFRKSFPIRFLSSKAARNALYCHTSDIWEFTIRECGSSAVRFSTRRDAMSDPGREDRGQGAFILRKTTWGTVDVVLEEIRAFQTTRRQTTHCKAKYGGTFHSPSTTLSSSCSALFQRFLQEPTCFERFAL